LLGTFEFLNKHYIKQNLQIDMDSYIYLYITEMINAVNKSKKITFYQKNQIIEQISNDYDSIKTIKDLEEKIKKFNISNADYIILSGIVNEKISSWLHKK